MAFAATSLQDLQAENVRKEKMQNILATIGIEIDREAAEGKFNEYIESQLSLRKDGSIDPQVDAFSDIKLAIEVKKEVDYGLIITTNAGLWRYMIGDTIKFTSLEPYRIKITGRTRHYINVFGEELNIENVEDALNLACKKTNSTITDYTLAPIFMEGKNSGGHEWLIEFKDVPENLLYFTELLDNALKSINSDYEAKRYNNLTLAFPKVNVGRKGLFYDWLKKKGKLGGQNKIPRLANDRQFAQDLEKYKK